MPGIWNINNGYGANSKKLSSKLTFEEGEKFTGRVVSKGEDKDVTIRLSDGWQFTAEVDENIDFEELKLIKFQVEGSENGKLKLKIINDDSSKDNADIDENFQEIIKKEGLSKEDINLLKKMITYNIPLTRKNISDIKALMQFNQKVNINENEAGAFIDKYIASKNIDINSEQGQAIKDVLTKFFEEFKNMSTDDIMLFVENNIEFNEENIQSYNKLFKGDSSVEKTIDNIKNQLKDMNLEDILNKESNSFNSDSLKKSTSESIIQGEKQSSSLASKVYSENAPINNKVDVLNILKTLASTNEESGNVESAVKNTLDGVNKEIVKELEKSDVLSLVKETIKDSAAIKDESNSQASKLIYTRDKANLERVLSNIKGKNVSLSDDEFKKIVNYIKETNPRSDAEVQSGNTNNMSKNLFLEEDASKDIFKALENSFNEKLDNSNVPIKDQIKSEIDKTSKIIKGLINQTDLNEAVKDKIVNVVKENLNDFKVFNSISNEYYYMNFNIAANNNDYPCKLIIKDDRKDGKKLDSTNAKMVVSVKTVNLGEIDSYLTLKDKKIDVNLKCNDDFELIIKKHRNELVEGLKTLGLMPSVTVSSKERHVDLASCRKFFNDVTISTIDTKV